MSFQFDHRKYKSRKIDLETLDKLFDQVVNSGTNRFAALVAGLKIAIFFAYLWARKRIIDEEFLIAKQEYEQNRTNTNSGTISDDDLD